MVLKQKIGRLLLTGALVAGIAGGAVAASSSSPPAPAPSQVPVTAVPAPPMAAPGGGPASFADLAHGLLPSVVNISSIQKASSEEAEDAPEMPHFPPGSPFEDFFEEFMRRHDQENPTMPAASLGSGFVIDAEKGLVVTNNHVVKDADEVRVTFSDDTTIKADVLGRDEKTDLAVLKVTTDKKLIAVKFGDSDHMRVGDWVLAIGNPFGLGGSVTAGIVSAQQRDIQAGPYDDFIQTDASINRGNSGGPMFNLAGEVIGINTAIFSPSGGSVGIGFAIPANLAKPVIDQLVEFGRTRRGWLGVRIQTVTDEIAESLGIGKVRGALVASVTPGGPADKSGIKSGDIILKFDDKEVNAMRSLPRIVAETGIGSEATMVLWRNGKEFTTKVAIGELEKAEQDGLLATQPKSESKGIRVEKLGMVMQELNDQARQDYDIAADVAGVLVSEVDAESEAGTKGLIAGDVVVEVNQQPVAQPQEVANVIQKADETGRSSVLLLVNRGGDVRFVALRLKK